MKWEVASDSKKHVKAIADALANDPAVIDAAAAVAEAAVSRKADAYRTKLAGSLHIGIVATLNCIFQVTPHACTCGRVILPLVLISCCAAA